MLELGHGYWSGFPSPLPSDIFSLLPVASVSKGLVSAPQSMQIQTFLVPSGRWLLCAQPMLRIVLSATPTRRAILLSNRYFLRTPPLCSTFVMRQRSLGLNKEQILREWVRKSTSSSLSERNSLSDKCCREQSRYRHLYRRCPPRQKNVVLKCSCRFRAWLMSPWYSASPRRFCSRGSLTK